MQIKEIARRTGASERSLRHYEQQGLLASRRLPNGYRDFDESAIERVHLIRSFLALGLTADQISHFLGCLDSAEVPICAEALAVYRAKLADVEDQLGALVALRERLHSHLAALGHALPGAVETGNGRPSRE